MGVILSAIKVAATWIFPSLVGYVVGDVVNSHEQSGRDDTLKSVAESAAGTAKGNWVKWLMYMVIAVAFTVISIFVFKIKKGKK